MIEVNDYLVYMRTTIALQMSLTLDDDLATQIGQLDYALDLIGFASDHTIEEDFTLLHHFLTKPKSMLPPNEANKYNNIDNALLSLLAKIALFECIAANIKEQKITNNELDIKLLRTQKNLLEKLGGSIEEYEEQQIAYLNRSWRGSVCAQTLILSLAILATVRFCNLLYTATKLDNPLGAAVISSGLLLYIAARHAPRMYDYAGNAVNDIKGILTALQTERQKLSASISPLIEASTKSLSFV